MCSNCHKFLQGQINDLYCEFCGSCSVFPLGWNSVTWMLEVLSFRTFICPCLFWSAVGVFQSKAVQACLWQGCMMVRLCQRRVTCLMGNFPMKSLHASRPLIQEDGIVVEVAPSSCLVYVRDIFQEVVTVKEALSHHALQMLIALLSAFGYLSGKSGCPHFNVDSNSLATAACWRS
jgi:hypothetical protein